jgi:hypothetical protein
MSPRRSRRWVAALGACVVIGGAPAFGQPAGGAKTEAAKPAETEPSGIPRPSTKAEADKALLEKAAKADDALNALAWARADGPGKGYETALYAYDSQWMQVIIALTDVALFDTKVIQAEADVKVARQAYERVIKDPNASVDSVIAAKAAVKAADDKSNAAMKAAKDAIRAKLERDHGYTFPDPRAKSLWAKGQTEPPYGDETPPAPETEPDVKTDVEQPTLPPMAPAPPPIRDGSEASAPTISADLLAHVGLQPNGAPKPAQPNRRADDDEPAPQVTQPSPMP